MIYIATVHFQTNKWIPIQLHYLKKNTNVDYRIYACLPADSPYKNSFYYSSDYQPPSTDSQNHADKLNFLAKKIVADASADDMIIFLDGDAFPIADYIPYVVAKLKEHALIAVQRRENLSDQQPHPCFCATTVQFWQKISGDWSPGFAWQNATGSWVTDTGGNLLQQLEPYSWHPLLRSNKKNLHPLWFGIYADLIYHHGAGYREPVSRLDFKYIPEFMESKQFAKNTQLHEQVFKKIVANEHFYRYFLKRMSWREKSVRVA